MQQTSSCVCVHSGSDVCSMWPAASSSTLGCLVRGSTPGERDAPESGLVVFEPLPAFFELCLATEGGREGG